MQINQMIYSSSCNRLVTYNRDDVLSISIFLRGAMYVTHVLVIFFKVNTFEKFGLFSHIKVCILDTYLTKLISPAYESSAQHHSWLDLCNILGPINYIVIIIIIVTFTSSDKSQLSTMRLSGFRLPDLA